MKTLMLASLIAAPLAAPVMAQDFGATGGREFSVELGLGVQGKPTYPGAEDAEASPWLIWQNAGFGSTAGDRQGFSISPSLGLVGPRDDSNDPALAGLNTIDRAYEVGAKVSYGSGPVTAYGSLRRGFDGHEGLTGELGATYRTQLSDRVTLWSGLELGYGNDEYSETYFGVSPSEAISSGYSEYSPGGGFTSAAIKFRARYAINDTTAILGEVEYGKLIGDAADSPIVQDDYQPALRLGIVRKFSFGF